MSVVMLVGSEIEVIFDVGDLQKKSTLHVVNFRAQKVFLCSFMKSDFQSSHGLFQFDWGPK